MKTPSNIFWKHDRPGAAVPTQQETFMIASNGNSSQRPQNPRCTSALHFFSVCLVSLLTCTPMLAVSGELVVAQVAAFSGPIAPYGEQTSLGAAVLFAAVNERGGVNGNTIRFVKRDDRMDPLTTVKLYEEVARTDKPVAFLYPLGPQVITSLLQRGVPQKLAIPVVGTIPSVFRLRQPVNPYAFHIGMGDDAEIGKVVSHIASLGIKRVGVVHWPDPSGLDSVQLMKGEASKRGIEVVAQAPVEPGTSNVAGAVQTMRRANVGSTVVFLPVDATGAFIKALRQTGDPSPVYCLSYNESSLLAHFAGADTANGVAVSQVVPNPFAGASQLLKDYHADMKRFAPAGSRVGSLSFEGYIAARILVEGIRRAGPNVTGPSVKAGLEKLRNFDLGGLVMNYGPADHVALRFQDIGVLRSNGRLAY